MCILYFDRERRKVAKSALYTAALQRRQELELAYIAAGNAFHEYADAVDVVDRASGAYAVSNALDHLAELTPSYPAWR